MRRPGSPPARATSRRRQLIQAADTPSHSDLLDGLISAKIAEVFEKRLGNITRSNASFLIVNHFYGDAHGSGGMGRDNYQGNTGFVGPDAGKNASGVTFNVSNRQNFSTIDLESLSSELPTLRRAMMQECLDNDNSPDHALAIGAIANAEKSAKAGDASQTFDHLKSAGKWAWETATKIGVSVAAKALEGTLNL